MRRRPRRPSVAADSSPVQRAARVAVEALERRQYFITLVGGDEFVFLDPESTLDDPNQVRIRLTGNITADIVGAYPTQFGGVGLTEIPGTRNGVAVLGGIGGVGGTRLLGTPGNPDPVTGVRPPAGIDVVDPVGGINVPFDPAGSDAINFRSIATDPSTNVMYGFNIIADGDGGTGVTGARIQLVRFDDVPIPDGRAGDGSVTGTVIADLTSALLNPANGATFNTGADHVSTALQGVTAAAFNPATGTLYFVVQALETIQLSGLTTGEVSIPQLFSIDVTAAGTTAAPTNGSATAVVATLDYQPTTFGYGQSLVRTGTEVTVVTNQPVVDSIEFDETNGAGSGDAVMYAVVHSTQFTDPGEGQDPVGTTVTQLFRGAFANGVFVNLAANERMTYQGQDINTITGVSIGVDDPDAISTVLYAVTSTATTESDLGGAGVGGGGGGGADAGGDTGQQLFEFQLDQPVDGTLPGLAIGFLPDTTDVVDPIRGEDLQGLTYNPLAIDPITNQPGAFVAVDATSDELVTISLARRFAVADVFQIYISAADRDASIGIVYYDATPEGFVAYPFDDGDSPNLPMVTGITPSLQPVEANSGPVYIGGRRIGTDRFTPFTEATYAVTDTFGNIPRPADNTLTAGIVSAVGVDMGNVLIGGVVTGEVRMGGSLETFYSGLLLTGEISGVSAASVIRPGNFTVAGDLSSLITKNHVGSLTRLVPGDIEQYATGFDAIVQGEVGHFQAVLGSVLGSVVAENAAGGYGDANLDQLEYETHTGPIVNPSGENMLNGLLGSQNADSAFLWNDTLANPQYLNAIGPDTVNGYVRLVGSLDDILTGTDTVDVYAITLMAGQTVAVRNRGGAVQVYDPDGRNIASDSAHFGANTGRAFKFTADRPGIYKFACVGPLAATYELNIRQMGNVTMGGVSAGLDIWNEREEESFRTGSGDIGAIFAGASISFRPSGVVSLIPLFTYDPSTSDFVGHDDVRAVAGNVRAVDASQIGIDTFTVSGNFNIQTDFGDIGLLRARSSFLTVSSAHVGGSLQLFDAFATGAMYLKALEGMGAFRAGDTATLPGYFRLNADETGADGILGLIDIAGDWGTNPGDGPTGTTPDDFNTNGDDPELASDGGFPIRTGQGGNVRYMHVGGAVYQDEFFGSGAPAAGRGSDTQFDVGVVKTYFDDGGGTIRITPLGTVTPNPAAVPDPITGLIDPTIDPNIGPQLTVITYGVRGSGGVVVVDASVSGANVEGVRIDGGAVGGGGRSVEIGTLAVRGLTGAEGTALTLNADGLPVLPGGTSRDRAVTRGPLIIDPITGAVTKTQTGGALGTATVPLVIDIGGSTRVDVFSVEGRATAVNAAADETVNSGASGGAAVSLLGAAFAGNFTRIANTTGGNLVNVRAANVASLTAAGSIGVPDFYEGLALETLSVVANTYPFVQQRSGIVATNLGFVQSNRAVGNLVVSGAINSVFANVDNSNDTSLYEGITGPIQAGANIGYVMVGEGLAYSGSGTVGLSGVYAGGIIYEVTNQGLGSDINGDIISLQEIRRIRLNDGSIINSDIQVASTFANGIESNAGGLFPGGSGNSSRPFYVIGSVNVSGRGGIIGSRFVASNIGSINVDDGFGIFSSQFTSIGNSSINRISTDGYGLRYNQIAAGENLNTLLARGNGEELSTARFSPTVRFTETEPLDEFYGVTFDPRTGAASNFLTDLHQLLGTSADVPLIQGVTDAGVIENTSVRGFRNLGTASAYQFRTRLQTQLPEIASEFPTELNFAAQIGSVTTKNNIDGLAITTGRLKRFAPGGDVYRLQLTVSSSVSSIKIKGTLGADSEIFASGPSATIGNVSITGDLDGILRASSRIGTVSIGGVATGTIQVDNLAGVTNIGSLTARRGIGQDNLTIVGSIGKIVTGYDASFGTTGGLLTVNGNLGSLKVTGGTLATSLTVTGDLGTLSVRGEIADNVAVTVGGNAKKIAVTNAAGAANDSVRGPISVGGNLGTLSIAGGNLVGNVTVGGQLTSLTQSRGNIGPGFSTPGVVPTITVGESLLSLKTTGNFLANMAAAVFGKVSIKGNLGDGTTPITSTASISWGTLNVTGSILGGSTTSIANTLDRLTVGGNVEANAVVAAGAITNKSIKGSVTGTVTP